MASVLLQVCDAYFFFSCIINKKFFFLNYNKIFFDNIKVLSGSMNIFDSYMTFLVGSALVYNTTYRALELKYQHNHPIIITLSLMSLASSSFCFYVAAAAPGVDAMAALSGHIHEASTLCLVAAILAGVVGCTGEHVFFNIYFDDG